MTLVVGGTRGTGRHVVDALVAKGDVVRVVSRRPERYADAWGRRVEVLPLDLAGHGAEEVQAAVRGVSRIVFTAGVAPGVRSEATLRATELDGLVRLCDVAETQGFTGRFVYLTTLGLQHPTWLLRLVDLVKWNEVAVRREAEASLAVRPFSVTVVRAGVLVDAPVGRRPLRLVPGDVPLSLGTRVARADVATLIVALLDGPPLREVGALWGLDEPPLSEQLLRLVGAPDGWRGVEYTGRQ